MPHRLATFTVRVATACALLLAGCGGPSPSSQAAGGGNVKEHEQWSTLMKRPDITETKKQYVRMQRELSDKLSQEFNLPKWTVKKEPVGMSGCGDDFSAVDEYDITNEAMPLWSSTAGISQSDQAKAKQAVQQIARKYGFSKVTSDVSKSKTWTFELATKDDSELTLMVNSYDHTVLRVSTGCRLNADAKRRGRPMNAAEKKAEQKTSDDELLRKAGVKPKHNK